MKSTTYAQLLIPALLAPASLLSQSPFDGTWRIDYAQSQLSQKPYVVSLNDGVFECSTCAPKINVKADGTDQSLIGQPDDTISVREIDRSTIQITNKNGGRIVGEQTWLLSDDGNTLTTKQTYHPKNGQQQVNSEDSLSA